MNKGWSWLSPNTIKKQNETEDTQLTSRLAISIPDCVMALNCCVSEKGTLARTNPAKKELIQAIAGIVVNIITIIPFMLSIIPDCIAIILLVASSGGRSPFLIRYPSSALHKKVLLQSNAYLDKSKYFFARFQHFWTIALSFVSWQCCFLTGFLKVVYAVQSVQQNLKSWIRQVTQMIGKNTHTSIRSSSNNYPIC